MTHNDYEVIHSSDYIYVGIAYPWFVVEKVNTKCPERRLLAYFTYINDKSKEVIHYDPLLPLSSYPKAE